MRRSRSTRARHRRPALLQVHHLEAREVPASLSGRVFLDYDNSGTFNGPDAGIPGVTITLSSPGLATPLTTTTDAQGNYTFGNLASDFYTVTETQPAAPASGIGRSIVGSGGTKVVVESRVQVPASYGLGVAGDNQVSGIYLSSASTVATGFNFSEIPLVGTGGFVFQDDNNNGIKDPGEPGIAGVTVTLTAARVVSGPFTPKTATTDANGAYTFADLFPGTYTITETQPGAYSDGPEQNGSPAATVGADRFTNLDLMTVAASGGFNFGEVKAGTLSGVVFRDADNDGTQAATGEPGIAGVKIVLTGSDGTGKLVNRTTTTGADGSYAFNNLTAGTYAVREVQPAGYADGVDRAGSLNGTVGNDRVTGIAFTPGATATGYTFAEKAVADLSLVQTPAAAVVNPNGTVTIIYTVRNRGSLAANAASVLINYGGLTFVSASNATAFISATNTWTVGTLATGATQTLRLTFRMPAAGGTFVTTARASTTTDQLSTKNDASASTISSMPAPAPVFGGLFASLNNYSPLTRLWLLSRFFG